VYVSSQLIRLPLFSPGGVDLKERFSEAERRSSSKGILYSLLAADEAIKSSRLCERPIQQDELERIGVAVGMGMTDLQDVLDTGKTLAEKGYSRVSPYFIPRILPNLAAGQISIKYGFQVLSICI
jgi:3-oxoacyl-[acyl-carrier-protein] synthase II